MVAYCKTPRFMHIDLETYSSVDLAECGVYKYAESEDFEILLFGYAFDDDEVNVLEHLTPETMENIGIFKALMDPRITKVAHNAAFERTCLSVYLKRLPQSIQQRYQNPEDEPLDFLPPEQWKDTMIMAAELGYPNSLAQLGDALGLPEDKKKMATGKRLIQYFCKPCKSTISNHGRTRNTAKDAPDKWATFVDYNRQDVVTERFIFDKLNSICPVLDQEWENWHVDQRINDRGLGIDADLVSKILHEHEVLTAQLQKEAQDLTQLANPNSLALLKSWIERQEGHGIDSLNKTAVTELLKQDITPETRRALQIRQELGKTSVKKYDSFSRSACQDNRVRGCFQFYGGRTGRFAGRLIQPQNFPRNTFDDFDGARELVKKEEWTIVQLLYGSLNDVFSTLIRTAIVPKEGYTFVVADYSAIEARVTAWLTRETWRQEAFKEGKDIYCASASQMFGVPVVKHGQNGHLRQKGKIAELALGYGGGVNALKAMGGEAMGLTEEEMTDIVQKWRKASPHIKKYWSKLDDAVRMAIQGIPTRLDRNMAVYKNGDVLFIRLPNGRSIAYVKPVIMNNEISYMGLNQTTRQWTRITTWGGKLTENVVQGIARDCLCDTMATLEAENFRPVMHVHDEVICEVPKDDADARLARLTEIMGTPPAWAPDIVLTADGFQSDYYKKD